MAVPVAKVLVSVEDVRPSKDASRRMRDDAKELVSAEDVRATNMDQDETDKHLRITQQFIKWLLIVRGMLTLVDMSWICL